MIIVERRIGTEWRFDPRLDVFENDADPKKINGRRRVLRANGYPVRVVKRSKRQHDGVVKRRLKAANPRTSTFGGGC